MTTTVEDAIQGYIAMQKKRLHPSQNAAFLRGIQTTIRILEKTPRDLDKVQLLIDEKEIALNKTDSTEHGDVLFAELQALEWLRMILRGSDRERENWALSSVKKATLNPPSRLLLCHIKRLCNSSLIYARCWP